MDFLRNMQQKTLAIGDSDAMRWPYLWQDQLSQKITICISEETIIYVVF